MNKNGGKSEKGEKAEEPSAEGVSRREFLSKGATVGVGIAATALAASTKASFAADTADTRPITRSQDLIDSIAMQPRPAKWPDPVAAPAAEAPAGGTPAAAPAEGAVPEGGEAAAPRRGGAGARRGGLGGRAGGRRGAAPAAAGGGEGDAEGGAAPAISRGGAGGGGLSGSQVFALACQNEGVGAFFCAPGNYGMINALCAQGIPSYGGRTEGAMCSAADGFARVTGEVAVCSGTEGPGFTNMIMNIASANAARSPVLVIASNRSFSADDTEGGIQTQYQQPLTEGIKKYGKRVISANRLYEYTSYAFRALKTGVPGVVHMDFPSEATGGRYTDPSALAMYAEKERYRATEKPSASSKEIDKAVAMIKGAQRPVIIAGHGVFYDKAWDSLKKAAEKNNIPVIESGPSRGHFGDSHKLSAGMAPSVLGSIDLVVFVGQYSMPSLGRGDGWRIGPDAKTIRVNPEAGDIGRNWPVDLGIVSGENNFLMALADALPADGRDAWVAEVAAGREAYKAQNDQYLQLGLQHSASTNSVHPAVIAAGMQDVLFNGDIDPKQVVTSLGGYGISRYTRRWVRANRPGQLNNGAYQYGAIGPDTGFTFGAAAAVLNGVGPQAPYKGAPVVGVTGDAGFAYTGFELETFAKYKIGAVMIVYNNNAWGMWTSSQPQNRHMYIFQENLRYDKVAEGLGARGVYVTEAEKFKTELKTAYDMAAKEGVTTLMNVQGLKEFWGNTYRPGFLQNVSPSIETYNH